MLRPLRKLPNMLGLSASLTLLAALISFVASSARAQVKPGLTPADTLRVTGVSDAQISPGGEWVVYVVSVTEGAGTRSTLWLARTAPELGSRPFEGEATSPATARATQPLLP